MFFKQAAQIRVLGLADDVQSPISRQHKMVTEHLEPSEIRYNLRAYPPDETPKIIYAIGDFDALLAACDEHTVVTQATDDLTSENPLRHWETQFLQVLMQLVCEDILLGINRAKVVQKVADSCHLRLGVYCRTSRILVYEPLRLIYGVEPYQHIQSFSLINRLPSGRYW